MLYGSPISFLSLLASKASLTSDNTTNTLMDFPCCFLSKQDLRNERSQRRRTTRSIDAYCYEQILVILLLLLSTHHARVEGVAAAAALRSSLTCAAVAEQWRIVVAAILLLLLPASSQLRFRQLNAVNQETLVIALDSDPVSGSQLLEIDRPTVAVLVILLKTNKQTM